ncbi:MAG TPA: type I restriction endonuclease [Phenylobacterium sp.]|nr:type I restriction endonuclease [Phenylobacterium sp.]
MLLTEEAAKTALVMPFMQALGYDVFNPSEVVPEYTADIGTKKGEKVDYAICNGGKITVLVECKSSSSELTLNNAGQLFRYFSVTDARLAILTNGVVYQFYSDIELPNRMDSRPFFTFSMDAIKPTDVKTLENFVKSNFDIDKIVKEAGNLKIQSLLRVELEKEFANPSDDFVKLLAKRVYSGNVTAAIKDNTAKLLTSTIDTIVRDKVTERLSSALNASTPKPVDVAETPEAEGEIITTEEEISGFRIVQAVASRLVDPKRIIMRDQKSYCGILLDDNNRKTVARMHFNGLTKKYFGTFVSKDESLHLISDLTDIYTFSKDIEKRLRELDESIKA